MRNLTNEELSTVAGGRGINIGDVGSSNSSGNGNSVDAGHNSASANGNGSGNSASATASAATDLMNDVSSKVTSALQDVVGGIL